MVWLPQILVGFFYAMAAAPLPGAIVADVEPNDTLASATATNLQLFGPVTVVGAEIGNGPLGPSDRDLFSFDVSPKVTLPVTLIVTSETSGQNIDVYVRVFDASGFDVARNDDSANPDLDARLQTYILEPGTYFVGVSHALNPAYTSTEASTGRAAGTGEYELTMSLLPAPALDASLEPNDVLPVVVEALPFSAPDQFIGDGPNLRLDADRFLVQVNSSSLLSVVVRPDAAGSLDPHVSVIVDGQTVEGFQSFDGVSRTRSIELAVLEPASVEIVVVGTKDAPDERDRQYGSVGFYRLDIDVTPVAALFGPFEPNDSILEATPVAAVGADPTRISAYIGDGAYGELRGDVDFYSVRLTPDDVLEVSVTPTAGPGKLNPVVVIYNATGLERGKWYADADHSINARFEFPCADAVPEEFEKYQGAIFAVAVMGAGDRITMDPLIPNPRLIQHPPFQVIDPPLSLFLPDGGPGSTGGYDLTISSSVSACATEPNDTIGDASEAVIVGAGKFVCLSGAAGDGPCRDDYPTSRDVDLFRVTVDLPPLTLDVRLESCSLLARELRLFDADGNELEPDGDGTPPSPGDTQVWIRTTLESSGDFFLGVSAKNNKDYDPLVACSGIGSGPGRNDRLAYDLEIQLTRPAANAPGNPQLAAGTAPGPERLFGTRLGFFPETIVELDPDTGQVVHEFPAPEVPIGPGDGLAVHGADLLMLGNQARFPFLYRLDSVTGQVLDKRLTWFGSGFYGDMIVLGGDLYVVDILEDVIWVVPDDLGAIRRCLDPGQVSGVSMFGAITAQLGPVRLIVPDAADPTILHVLEPQTGRLWLSFHLNSACPCGADFDGDDDIDAVDAAFFDACDILSGVAFGCLAADLNCDGDIDSSDREIFDCLSNSPTLALDFGCCAPDLPSRAVRATGLTTGFGNRLITADWANPGLSIFAWDGTPMNTVALETPLGSLAGSTLSVFGDWNGDGDVDLFDWQYFQLCFDETGSPPPGLGCEAFDFDRNGFVNLSDYGPFFDLITGRTP